MENNKEKWQDHKDSLGAAIREISYPFDSLSEKIDIVSFGLISKDITTEEKKSIFNAYFKKYYNSPSVYNFYGLEVQNPF